jgi:dodecin
VTDNTYKVSEIVGTSPDSVHQAIRNGIKKAGESIRNLDWFEVVQIRGHIVEGGEVGHFQVVMKLGFRVEE